MRLLMPVCAALALALTPLASAVPVKPAWTVPGVGWQGFAASGELLTRPRLASGEWAGTLERRDPATGEVRARLDLAPDMGLLTVTPDLTGGAWLNRSGDVLTVRTPGREWRASTPGLSGTLFLRFSPDGNTLVLGNANGYVQLWDVAAGERRATLLLASRPEAVAFHPDGERLAVNERGWHANRSSVTLWRLSTGEQVGEVPGVRGVLRPFAFAPDGTLVVPLAYSVGWLDPVSGRVVRRLPTYTEPCPPDGQAERTCARGVWTASLSADGQRVLANSAERRGGEDMPVARLYDAGSGALLGTWDTPHASATLSPDARTLLLNTWMGELQGVTLP
ncbi:hypothetical protein F8S09_09470 [Deinococcus sp. SDU3-2]|uniref:WD40 repeat domain-containing protein n=1 Tax=Deinococcus terrestris TaxID=2651870 RepID=A0A7X1NW61_9DEIO|nr:hypothetical protein [Deinococcus terrestris]MPY66917.1 hypothetical protein [Deinococcus terrestris]